MILVFDLDDTLFEELSFVKSGFRVIAGYLSALTETDQDVIFIKLMHYLSIERNYVIDNVLTDYNIYKKSLVKKCLSEYRKHQPRISLYPDAIRCLKRFSGLNKYVVTDGNKIVQTNKIKALGLDNYIKFAFITHNYGINHAKPSAHVFYKICNLEKVKPEKVLYIGDNPHKDFVGLKLLGFRTIRIMRGNYKEIKMEDTFEAELMINTLDELSGDFLKRFFHERIGN